MSKVDYRNKV